MNNLLVIAGLAALSAVAPAILARKRDTVPLFIATFVILNLIALWAGWLK